MACEGTQRSPTLDTLFMIEDFVRQHSGEFTKTQLWRNLPRKVMYQTFCVAFSYLLNSSKIAVNPRNGRILWIWDQHLVRKVLLRREADKLIREVVKVPSGRISLAPGLKKFEKEGA